MQRPPTVPSIVMRFAVTSAICIGAFWFLRWLAISYQIVEWNTKIWENGIPFLFPALPIFIFLRPEVKKANWLNERATLTTLIVAYFGIVVPMKLSQEFMSVEYGKLYVVNSIDDITKSQGAGFYKIKNVAVDRSTIVSDVQMVKLDRKSSSTYECNVYVAMPFVGEPTSKSLQDLKYWLCIKSTQTYGSIPEPSLRSSVEIFHSQCVRAMENYRTEQVNYLSTRINSKDFDAFESIIRQRSGSPGELTILTPQTTPFKRRTSGSLAWVFVAYVLATGAVAITLVFPRDYLRLKTWVI